MQATRRRDMEERVYELFSMLVRSTKAMHTSRSVDQSITEERAVHTLLASLL